MANPLDLENAAKKSSLRYLGADEPLLSLHIQPDRAIFRTERSGILFKVYVEGKPLEHEYEVIRKAKAAGVPVPETLGVDVNTFTVLTMKFLSGAPLNARYKNAAREAGKYLRRFHSIKAGPPFSGGQHQWYQFISWWSNKEIRSLNGLDILSYKEQEVLKKRFDKLRSILLDRPIVLLHGDLQIDHILVDPEKDKVIAFLDFADAQPGDPLLDIAVLTLWDHALTPLLLEGYASIEDTEQTQNMISHYRLLRHIAEIPWLYNRGYTELANRNILRVKEAISNL